MHSIIFEVCTPEEKTNGYESRLSEEWFNQNPHDFYDRVQDLSKYEVANELESFNEDFKELLNEKDDIYEITNDVARNYFMDSYNLFRNAASEISLDDFCGNNSYEGTDKIRKLKHYMDDCSYYVMCDEIIYSFDEFIRYKRMKFCVVNAMDYHSSW